MFQNKTILICLTLIFISSFSYAQFLNSSLRKDDMDEVYADAVRLTQEKKYIAALPLAQKAVSRYPNNSDYNLLLSRIHTLMGNPKLARPYVIKTLSQSPNYKDAYYQAISIEMSVKNTNQAIVYANRALIRFPNDIGFNIKKLSIYDQTNNFAAGDAMALDLIQKYPANEAAKKAWVGHHEAAGRYYKEKGQLAQAQHYFQEALKVSPDNKDANESLATLSLKSGNRESALQQVNSALASNPNSYNLLTKKLGILQEMRLYADATAVSKKLKTLFPGDSKVRETESELKLDASRYYEHTDPYVLYQTVLDGNPGNREALDKLIGISMDRGVYRNALDWINQGLKSSPSDFVLLSKKADVLEILDNKLGAAEIVNYLWMRNPDSENLRVRASELKVSAGKHYIADKQFDKALAEFEMALNIDPSNIDALTYITNIYIEQKDYESALSALSMALVYREDDEGLLLKKASVLADAGRYNEAFPVVSKLIELYPDNPRYGAILTEQQMQAGRSLMNNDEMDQAVNQFKNTLQFSPTNKDALTYIINLESGMNRLDTALFYVEKALGYYPDDKDFLFKKVSVLSEQKRNKQAYDIAAQLMKAYPYNKSYRAAYLDNVVASGYSYQKEEQWVQALSEFKKVLVVSPFDTSALYASINLSNAIEQPDSALALIGKGLKYYPENRTLWHQKAVTYEMLQDYEDAVLAAENLVKLLPSEKNKNYLEFLESKLSRDQFGVFYHQSSYDNNSLPFRILSLEYRRFFKKGSIAGRLNYGTRTNGGALQAEVDAVYNHNKTLYSNFNVAYPTNQKIFPKIKVSYSLFKSWKNDWETEIGGRYLQITGDSLEISDSNKPPRKSPRYAVQSSSIISGVVGVSKGIDDFWFNLKGYFMFDTPEQVYLAQEEEVTDGGIHKDSFFQAYLLTGRYYMNDRKEFMYLIGGLGTSPDDRSRIIQAPQLSGAWLNQFVAVGYQKTFNHKTTVNGSLGWGNNKIGPNTYIAQYDIYLALIRKF